MLPVHSALTGDLGITTFYRILRLRAEVFVVEQRCPYADPDGRDLEPGCVQLWCEGDGGQVVATGRLLVEGDRHRIGRVCTAPAARGRGLAAALIGAALVPVGDGPVVLDAQSHLTDWYGTFGFVSTGREFLEDGIPHTEMVRPRGAGCGGLMPG